MKAFEDESLLLPNRHLIFRCVTRGDAAVHSMAWHCWRVPGDGVGSARLSAALLSPDAAHVCDPRGSSEGWCFPWPWVRGQLPCRPAWGGLMSLTVSLHLTQPWSAVCTPVCSFHVYFQQRHYLLAATWQIPLTSCQCYLLILMSIFEDQCSPSSEWCKRKLHQVNLAIAKQDSKGLWLGLGAQESSSMGQLPFTCAYGQVWVSAKGSRRPKEQLQPFSNQVWAVLHDMSSQWELLA